LKGNIGVKIRVVVKEGGNMGRGQILD